MKLTIVHMSDIHIKDQNDQVLARSKEISSELYQFLPWSTHFIIVVSGDIAYSGKKAEYRLANDFFLKIKRNLEQEAKAKICVDFIFSPGNHDCNHEKSTSVRNAVLNQIDTQGVGIIDDDLVGQCVSVQGEFFEFRDDLTCSEPESNDHLATTYVIKSDDSSVVFNCLNVSWASRLKEVQGALYFPVEKAKESQNFDGSDLVLTLLHHPLNWYSQDTYHEFKSYVRDVSDFVLSGHEHVHDIVESTDLHENATVQVEAPALQGDGNDSLGFSVIQIDLENLKFRIKSFRDLAGSYTLWDDSKSWADYKNLPSKVQKTTSFCRDWEDFLTDPGANFSHPGKSDLRLPDFFIYPDVEELYDAEKSSRVISGSSLTEEDRAGQKILLKGEEKAGKTALLKRLVLDFYSKGFMPLYLSAKDIKKTSNHDLEKLIDRNVKSQFGEPAVADWRRLERAYKVVLIDDLEKCPVKDVYRHKIVDFLNSYFDRVIITTDLVLNIHELVDIKAAHVFDGYVQYDIRPFGYRLRGDLINKWYRIGNKEGLSSEEFIAQTDRAEKIINTVVGKNLVPRVPFYLLTILQSTEASLTSELQNSELGHYYQFLITQSLKRSGIKNDELEEIYNFCSRMAWVLDSSQSEELDEAAARGFSGIYSKQYVSVNFEERFKNLCEARILQNRDGYYSFLYPYQYYYFLGKYLADNLSSDDIKESEEAKQVVIKYCSHLYVRGNANTILFVIHHSKDRFIIDNVLNSMKSLFSDYEPLDLSIDSNIVNDLIDETANLIFSGGNPVENRIEKRVAEDEYEANQTETDYTEELEGALVNPPGFIGGFLV
ncbi:metallophosphoesterase [uncultured Spongiibacter sp.]|uniref:metallophosphoesterase n=1 Tax=uncultured Spongiibacter sp. TaxID=870896 RepID=UPI0025828858|nr:metallophosphoesterase [uncultured Spongiibacter sp.]